jgi:hypothetical protein
MSLVSKEDLLKIAKNFNYGVSIDLKNGYYNLKLDKKILNWICFKFEGKTYRYNVLPFGLSSAPAAFQTVTHWIATKSGVENIKVYLDDFLIYGNTIEEVERDKEKLINTLGKFNMNIHIEKSNLTPSSNVEYLGYCIDFGKHKLLNKVDRIEKLSRDIWQVINLKSVRKGMWSKLLGKINFANTKRLSRIDLNPLYRHLKGYTRQHKNCLFKLTKGDREALINIAMELEEPFDSTENLTKTHTKRTQTTYTDASGFGMGAIIDNTIKIASKWNLDLQMTRKAATYKELLAIISCTRFIQPDSKWMINTDAKTLVSILNKKQYARSMELNVWIRALINWAKENNIEIQVQHVKGADNTEADRLSRLAEFDLTGYSFEGIKLTKKKKGDTIVDIDEILLNFILKWGGDRSPALIARVWNRPYPNQSRSWTNKEGIPQEGPPKHLSPQHYWTTHIEIQDGNWQIYRKSIFGTQESPKKSNGKFTILRRVENLRQSLQEKISRFTKKLVAYARISKHKLGYINSTPQALTCTKHLEK